MTEQQTPTPIDPVTGPVKCRTSLMGLIFGHKFYYRIRAASITQTTNVCVRCGWTPRAES